MNIFQGSQMTKLNKILNGLKQMLHTKHSETNLINLNSLNGLKQMLHTKHSETNLINLNSLNGLKI
jgi:hypothetical protein